MFLSAGISKHEFLFINETDKTHNRIYTRRAREIKTAFFTNKELQQKNLGRMISKLILIMNTCINKIEIKTILRVFVCEGREGRE